MSILFCLINSEVQFQLGKFMGDHGIGGVGGAASGRSHSLAMTQYTVRHKILVKILFFNL